jgi:hypothetical protein
MSGGGAGGGDFVGPSLLPAAGGTIIAMHGGATLLPEAGGTIVPMRGGRQTIENALSKRPVSAVPPLPPRTGQSVRLNQPARGKVQGARDTAQDVKAQGAPRDKAQDATRDARNARDIILFGTPLTLTAPTDGAWTADQQKALSLFGLEGLKRRHQHDILQALYDGTCNTNQPLALMMQCEPIRRVVYTLALELKGRIAQVSAENADRRAQNAAEALRRGADMRMTDATTPAAPLRADLNRVMAATAKPVEPAEDVKEATVDQSANALAADQSANALAAETLSPETAVEIATAALAAMKSKELTEAEEPAKAEEPAEGLKPTEPAEAEEPAEDLEEAEEPAEAEEAAEDLKEEPAEELAPDVAIEIATAALAALSTLSSSALTGATLLTLIQSTLRRVISPTYFTDFEGKTVSDVRAQLAADAAKWTAALEVGKVSPPDLTPLVGSQGLAEAAGTLWRHTGDVDAAVQYAMYSIVEEGLKDVTLVAEGAPHPVQAENAEDAEDAEGIVVEVEAEAEAAEAAEPIPDSALTDEEAAAVNAMTEKWEAQLALADATAQLQSLRISIRDSRDRATAKKASLNFKRRPENRAEGRRDWQGYRDMNAGHVHDAAAQVSSTLLTQVSEERDAALERAKKREAAAEARMIPFSPAVHKALHTWLAANQTRLQREMMGQKGLVEQQQAAQAALDRAEAGLSRTRFMEPLAASFSDAADSKDPYKRAVDPAQFEFKLIAQFKARDKAFFDRYVEIAVEKYRVDGRYYGTLAAIQALQRLARSAFPEDPPMSFVLERPVGEWYVEQWRKVRRAKRAQNAERAQASDAAEAVEDPHAAHKRQIDFQLIAARLRAEHDAYQHAGLYAGHTEQRLAAHQKRLEEAAAENTVSTNARKAVLEDVTGLHRTAEELVAFFKERGEAAATMEKSYASLAGPVGQEAALAEWLTQRGMDIQQRLTAATEPYNRSWVDAQAAVAAVSFERVEDALEDAMVAAKADTAWIPKWLEGMGQDKVRKAMLTAAKGVLAERGPALHASYARAMRDKAASEAEYEAAVAEAEAWREVWREVIGGEPPVDIQSPQAFGSAPKAENREAQVAEAAASMRAMRAEEEAARKKADEAWEACRARNAAEDAWCQLVLQEVAMGKLGDALERMEAAIEPPSRPSDAPEVPEAPEAPEAPDAPEAPADVSTEDAEAAAVEVAMAMSEVAEAIPSRLTEILQRAEVDVNALDVTQKRELMQRQDQVAEGKMTVEELEKWLREQKPAVPPAPVVPPAPPAIPAAPEISRENQVAAAEAAIKTGKTKANLARLENLQRKANAAMEKIKRLKRNKPVEAVEEPAAPSTFNEDLKEINAALENVPAKPVKPVEPAVEPTAEPAEPPSVLNQAIEATQADQATAERDALIASELARPSPRPLGSLRSSRPTKRVPGVKRNPRPNATRKKGAEPAGNLKAAEPAENLKAEKPAENLKAEKPAEKAAEPAESPAGNLKAEKPAEKAAEPAKPPRSYMLNRMAERSKETIGLINGLSKVGITPATLSEIADPVARKELQRTFNEVADKREAIRIQYANLEKNPSAVNTYKALINQTEHQLRDLKLGFQKTRGGTRRARKARLTRKVKAT